MPIAALASSGRRSGQRPPPSIRRTSPSRPKGMHACRPLDVCCAVHAVDRSSVRVCRPCPVARNEAAQSLSPEFASPWPQSPRHGGSSPQAHIPHCWGASPAPALCSQAATGPGTRPHPTCLPLLQVHKPVQGRQGALCGGASPGMPRGPAAGTLLRNSRRCGGP